MFNIPEDPIPIRKSIKRKETTETPTKKKTKLFFDPVDKENTQNGIALKKKENTQPIKINEGIKIMDHLYLGSKEVASNKGEL